MYQSLQDILLLLDPNLAISEVDTNLIGENGPAKQGTVEPLNNYGHIGVGPSSIVRRLSLSRRSLSHTSTGPLF